MSIGSILAVVKDQVGTLFNIGGLQDTSTGRSELGHLITRAVDLAFINPAMDETSVEINASVQSVVSEMSTANTSLEQIAISTGNCVAIGTIADGAYNGSGATTVVGGLKGVYAALITTGIKVTSTALPTNAAQETGGNLATLAGTVTAGSLKVVIQAGGATPLPTNAAQETGGNLAAILSSTGAVGDGAYTGSGNSTTIAALKGIYAILAAWVGVGTFASATQALSNADVQVFAAAGSQRRRVKLINNDAVTASGGAGITIWLKWGSAASVRGSGCFPLLPGASQDDAQFVNQGSLHAIAESGTPNLYWETY